MPSSPSRCSRDPLAPAPGFLSSPFSAHRKVQTRETPRARGKERLASSPTIVRTASSPSLRTRTLLKETRTEGKRLSIIRGASARSARGPALAVAANPRATCRRLSLSRERERERFKTLFFDFFFLHIIIRRTLWSVELERGRGGVRERVRRERRARQPAPPPPKAKGHKARLLTRSSSYRTRQVKDTAAKERARASSLGNARRSLRVLLGGTRPNLRYIKGAQSAKALKSRTTTPHSPLSARRALRLCHSPSRDRRSGRARARRALSFK